MNYRGLARDLKNMHEIFPVNQLDDPRLEPYRDLRHRNLTHFSQRFIAEGWSVVERLLESSFLTESVLCAPKYLEQVQAKWKHSGAIYVLPNEQFSELVGFNFHRGVLACAHRKNLSSPIQWLNDHTAWPQEFLWGGVVGVQDPENFGSILRTCCGLGIDTVLVGPDCCDPYSRRVLRTSMGNSLKLRLLGAERIEEVIGQVRQRHQVQVISACLADDSVGLQEVLWQPRRLVLLGNEGHGLPRSIQNESDVRLRIEMQLGTDSLNVSVAAGIILHYASRLVRS
ncbi:MAG: tRNA ((18)-2-O)-methyltransferase [Planctomycetota bacterium]